MWSGAKCAHLVDLEKCCKMSIYYYYLVVKIGLNTAENRPLKNCQKLAKMRQKIRINMNTHRTSFSAQRWLLRIIPQSDAFRAIPFTNEPSLSHTKYFPTRITQCKQSYPTLRFWRNLDRSAKSSIGCC